MGGLVGDDEDAGFFKGFGAAAPPVGDHPAGFFDQQDAGGGVDKTGFFKVARQTAAGDPGAGIGGAADDADGADGRADGVEAIVGAGM
ncbi:hypothetical protein D3C87_1931270 [compost metagenome]